MKIAIVYYSYSGNTHRLAVLMKGILEKDSSVSLFRIEAQGESRVFFVQALRGALKKRTGILPVETDFSGYDLIILGTPVWAREMVPAMRSYLEKMKDLSGKKAMAFVTYGSGFGKEHCLASIGDALSSKKADYIGGFSVSQSDVDNRARIDELLKSKI